MKGQVSICLEGWGSVCESYGSVCDQGQDSMFIQGRGSLCDHVWAQCGGSGFSLHPASELHMNQGPSLVCDWVHDLRVIRVVAQFVRRVWDLCVRKVGALFVIGGLP